MELSQVFSILSIIFLMVSVGAMCHFGGWQTGYSEGLDEGYR